MKLSKKDGLLILLFLCIAVGIYVYYHSTERNGDTVVVTVDGTTYGTYALNKNGSYEIINGKHKNVIKITNGTVTMQSASCHNQICVHHQAITKQKERIICLPNKVVVQIVSKHRNTNREKESADLDDIAQ